MLISYADFCNNLANKFHARSSIHTIYCFEFDHIKSTKNDDEFEVVFWLKDQYKTQLKDNELRPAINDTLILTWCQQVTKVLLNQLFPATLKARFFITDQRIISFEPCFEDIPVKSKIRILSQREEKNKFDVSLLFQLGENQMSVRIDLTTDKHDKQSIEDYYQRHISLYGDTKAANQ